MATRAWDSRSDMLRSEPFLYFFLGSAAISIIGIFSPASLPWAAVVSLALVLFGGWKRWSALRQSTPRSKAFRELQKIREKHQKIATDRHHHINDQIAYIETEWGYTREQNRVIERFLKQRAYSKMYNRLSASILPQLITLVDQCNAKGQKGCKREVSRRIRELTQLMREELRRKKTESRENFEVSLEVYDHLLREGR